VSLFQQQASKVSRTLTVPRTLSAAFTGVGIRRLIDRTARFYDDYARALRVSIR